jgi:DNA-binding transcriptional LysR family regulator
VASIYSVGLHHMSRYVGRFREAYPEADVRIEYLHPTKVIESVIAGETELGLVSFPRKWPELTVIPWREEEMVLAVPPSHRFAKLEEVDAEQLDGETFVGFESELPIRRAVDRFLRKHGVHVRVALEFDNIETIKRAVEIGLGCAIVPRMTVENEVTRGTLRLLEFQEGTFLRPLAIIYKRGRELSPAVRKFIEVLTSSTVSPRSRAEKAADRALRGERAERTPDSSSNDRLEKTEKSA